MTPPGAQIPVKEPKGDDSIPAEEEVKTNVKESGPAFGNVRLSQEEQNEFYLDLAEFLLDKSLCNLSLKCL
jgi:hypothetical protein